VPPQFLISRLDPGYHPQELKGQLPTVQCIAQMVSAYLKRKRETRRGMKRERERERKRERERQKKRERARKKKRERERGQRERERKGTDMDTQRKTGNNRAAKNE